MLGKELASFPIVPTNVHGIGFAMVIDVRFLELKLPVYLNLPMVGP